jgi:general stress protein YciG
LDSGALLLEPTEDVQMANTKSGSSKRGFAAMSPEKQREIAAKGGRASHGGGRRPNSARTGNRSGR